MFTVDSYEWDYPCSVERNSKIESSDISGMMLDRSYFNDVIGTFMSYSINIAVPVNHYSDYDAIYEILNEPVDGHEFVLPYAGGTLSVTGRVESIRDNMVRDGNGIHWRRISFDVTANHPTKEMDLEEVLMRGVAPLPDTSDVSPGSAYGYGETGWEELESADDNYY